MVQSDKLKGVVINNGGGIKEMEGGSMRVETEFYLSLRI